MEGTQPRQRRRGSARRLLIAAAAGVSALAVTGSSGPSRLRLVAVMHDNLAAVNEIVEGISLDDYARVESEAARLRSLVASTREVAPTAVSLDGPRQTLFEQYLTAQSQAADAIARAARQRQPGEVLLGTQRLLDEACSSCHADFREGETGRTAQVAFMRTLLGSVQGITRGLAMNDFTLVGREARAIGAIAEIFTWSQVMEAMFDVSTPADKEEFRRFLGTLSSQAMRLESAAMGRDPRKITAAARRMLEEGCVSCHSRFRTKNRGL